MYRKPTKEEQEIINDFEHWISLMEKKHNTVSANIYVDIRRYLNRMDRQLSKCLASIKTDPLISVPEKYKNLDWMKDV